MPKPLHDNVRRRKSPSPAGRAVFVGLRALDAWWQFHLLRRGWASEVIQTLRGQSVAASQIWRSPLGPQLQLQPYYGLVSLLALGSSVKHIVTILVVSEQETPVGDAVLVGVFNTLFNTVNTLLSVWSVTSQVPAPASGGVFNEVTHALFSNPVVAVGVAAYLVGILTEMISEFQRRAFKKNPANKGKPYGGGLFALATNINYGGYTVWRAAYALVTGGWPAAVVTFAFFFHDFASRGVPVMDEYLTRTYGDAYKEIKQRVRYSLIPGVY